MVRFWPPRPDAQPQGRYRCSRPGQAVTEAKAGKIEYRLDKQNIIHVPVGKASFGAEKLYTNLDTVMSAIAKAKPAAAKGTYFKSATIATTMGPGIRLNTLKYGV